MVGASKVAVLSAAVLEKETTWSVANGAVTPMPTLVLSVALLTPLIPPSTSELLWSTRAREPIAEALVRLDPTFVPYPIAVLRTPLGLPSPAENPKKELPPPVSFEAPALSPKKELPSPLVLLEPASLPKKEFCLPAVLMLPA